MAAPSKPPMRHSPHTCSARRAIACASLLLCLPGVDVHAAEGMWTLDNLPLAELRTMYGFTPDASWIARTMHASVRLEDGCSGSFVSANGLAMTNHHCVEDCASQLSTPQHDLLGDGFLARSPADERRCPDFALDRLDSIVDVTERIAKATRGLSGAAYADAQSAEAARIESECAGKDGSKVRCEVVDLYHGAQRHLYRYHRYDDVRLVFAPEIDVAQFGGDPDNFSFPRYDLDVGLVRAYENGKPVQVKDFFRFARTAAQAGDLAITSGHPGRTQRQLTIAQLERVRDVDAPWRLLMLAEQRGLVTRYAAESAENARVSKGELDDIENSYKATYGELQALRDPAVFATKRAEEDSLRALAADRPALRAELSAWDEVAAAQKTWRDIALRHRFTEGAQGLWTRYFDIARGLLRAGDERIRPDAERLDGYSNAALPALEQSLLSAAPIHPDFEQAKLAWSLTKLREWLGADDPIVKRVLGRDSPQTLAARWVAESRLGDPAVRAMLWRGGKAAVDASDDPFLRVARLLDPDSRASRKRVDADVDAIEQRNAARIARVRFAQSGTHAYPDATFTLRLSFGVVEGWRAHGTMIGPYTTVAGLFDRATGNDPFRLPPSWLNAKTMLDPTERMNFTTSNDIIGGNSGSPVLNRDGEIVGLAFDGNLDSLGGAFWWDQRSNRMVAVTSGLILDALDKIYHADRLLDEIRHP